MGFEPFSLEIDLRLNLDHLDFGLENDELNCHFRLIVMRFTVALACLLLQPAAAMEELTDRTQAIMAVRQPSTLHSCP